LRRTRPDAHRGLGRGGLHLRHQSRRTKGRWYARSRRQRVMPAQLPQQHWHSHRAGCKKKPGVCAISIAASLLKILRLALRPAPTLRMTTRAGRTPPPRQSHRYTSILHDSGTRDRPDAPCRRPDIDPKITMRRSDPDKHSSMAMTHTTSRQANLPCGLQAEHMKRHSSQREELR